MDRNTTISMVSYKHSIGVLKYLLGQWSFVIKKVCYTLKFSFKNFYVSLVDIT